MPKRRAAAASRWFPDVGGRREPFPAHHAFADDVVVRQRRSKPNFVYVLGTPRAPNQFVVRSYDGAVGLAAAFAKSQRVRAWFDEGDDTFRLLRAFRVVKPAKVVSKSAGGKKKTRTAPSPVVTPEAAMDPTDDAVGRLRRDFLEKPGLRLQFRQVQRLCAIDWVTCQLVLDRLVEAQFLRLESDGAYALLPDRKASNRRAVTASLKAPPRL